MKQLQCEALIFDLDGVLVDSSAVVERHWRWWARERGLDGDALMGIVYGRRTVEVIRHVAPHLDAEQEARRLAAREGCDTEGLLVMEGALALTRSLPEDAWAVATSGTRDTATTRLQHTHLPLPAVLITADDVTLGKPDPQVYLLAADRLGVPPARCIVVEDAPAGVEAARAAGMRVVAVTTTHTPEALAGADVITGNLLDIRIVPDGKATSARARTSRTLLQMTIRSLE
jgi:sugar-phosphatase